MVPGARSGGRGLRPSGPLSVFRLDRLGRSLVPHPGCGPLGPLRHRLLVSVPRGRAAPALHEGETVVGLARRRWYETELETKVAR